MGGVMKVLVTGGCGFIGSHVVDAYIDKGCEVVVVDNLSMGKIENKNDKAKLYTVDIRSETLEDVFAAEQPDLVNHHAAQISVPLSVKEPILDAEINIKGTIRLLELSRKYGARKFLFSSTGGAIYGEATEVPTDEDYVPEPASPYAISKLACEKYIRFYHLQHGLSYVILRYSNVYGPRQIPHGEAGVVAIFLEKLLAGGHCVLYHFPDDKRGMVRDYCYVKDVARANILATDQGEIGTFNIGTGIGTHTLGLYKEILNALRRKGVGIPPSSEEPLSDSARPGDIRANTLNVKRARELLRWSPEYHLERGVLETAGWYLKDEA
jgi:UDP-glucose 4-epimerase